MTGDDTTRSEGIPPLGEQRAERVADDEGAKTAVLLDMGPLEETMPEVATPSPTSGSAAAAVASAAAVNRKRPSNEVVSEGSSRRRPSVVAEDKTAEGAGQQSAQWQPPPPSSWFSSALVRYGVFALFLLLLMAAFTHWCLC